MISDSVLRSAMASKLAYAKSTKLVATFPISRQLDIPHNHYQIIENRETGAHAYIWNTGESSKLIAFRGSHDLKDIVSYINTKQVSFSFCDRTVHVHQRLYEMFASIEPHITSLLFTDGFSKKQHITFCGHSMGGSLAMFASVYYAHLTNGNHDITCHTFGAPKLGDAAFVSWFTYYVDDYVNMCNKCDFVPYFPFNTSKYMNTDLIIETRYTTDNIINDHDLETYISNIRNNIHLMGRQKPV